MNETEISQIAKAAALEAIAEVRKAQKRGRKDTAGGSKVVGGITRDFREQECLTISAMAEKTGLHPTTIGKIEDGQRGMSLRTFAKIAAVLQPQYADRVILHEAGK